MKNIRELISDLHKYHNSNDNKNEIITLLKISQYYYNNSEFEKAELNLLNILDIDNNFPKIYYYLAQVNIMLNKTKKAIKYLDKELKLNPNDYDSKILKEKIIINNNFPYATLILIFLNILVYFFTGPNISFINLIRFGLNSNMIEISNIISSIFFHTNLIHIISNSIMLLMFGLILEKQIGTFKFTIIYLISAITGNLIQVLLVNNSFVIGASSGIFGIIGALMIIKPRLNLNLFGFIKIPLILIFGAYFIISNLFIKFILLNSNVQIGSIAHIFGFLTGILITGILYRERINIFYAWIGISIGFYLIGISINLFITLFNFYLNLNKVVHPFQIIIEILFYLIIGIALEYYSYNILKIIDFGD